MTVHTRHLTRLRLLVKDVMVEFLSNDLKTRKAFVLISLNGFICAEGATVTSGCLLYLRWEEPLYPAGKERFAKDAVDWGPLPGVALKQLRQERAQVLGIMQRHGRVWATDDLQHQILHVSCLKLRKRKKNSLACLEAPQNNCRQTCSSLQDDTSDDQSLHVEASFRCKSISKELTHTILTACLSVHIS